MQLQKPRERSRSEKCLPGSCRKAFVVGTHGRFALIGRPSSNHHGQGACRHTLGTHTGQDTRHSRGEKPQQPQQAPPKSILCSWSGGGGGCVSASFTHVKNAILHNFCRSSRAGNRLPVGLKFGPRLGRWSRCTSKPL